MFTAKLKKYHLKLLTNFTIASNDCKKVYLNSKEVAK